MAVLGLVKINSVLGLDQNQFSPRTGSKLIHLTLSSDLFVRDVIFRLGLNQIRRLDRADLKYSPVLIVGFEI